MLAFPGMIAEPAAKAGIPVPPEDETDNYDPTEYPHFAIFCALHLGQPVDWGTLQDKLAHNAKMIAAIPDDKIGVVTFDELRELGWWE